ncbi:MAG: SDR family oxidoreductase [Planctomycetes bacterium]|nr:SDR family oxidoreductase [Planctomycetota bacterium]
MASTEPVAIITGGSAGIGLAAARELASSGWKVAITGRDTARLEAAAASIGGAVETYTADQADPEAAARVIETVSRRHARLDALILNAGWAQVRSIPLTGIETLRDAYAVNAIGPAYEIHRAWGIFEQQRSGRIIGVSSYAAWDPFPGFFAYAGTKAALNLMIRSAAQEGAPIGVTAFSVAPGAVETALLRSAFDEGVVPKSACLSPENVAGVIAACATGQRDHDTGKTIYLKRDGDGVHEMVV